MSTYIFNSKETKTKNEVVITGHFEQQWKYIQMVFEGWGGGGGGFSYINMSGCACQGSKNRPIFSHKHTYNERILCIMYTCFRILK